MKARQLIENNDLKSELLPLADDMTRLGFTRVSDNDSMWLSRIDPGWHLYLSNEGKQKWRLYLEWKPEIEDEWSGATYHRIGSRSMAKALEDARRLIEYAEGKRPVSGASIR